MAVKLISCAIMRHFMLAKIVPLQKRFPIGTRHIMVKNLVITPFLIGANIDEALMLRHIMISTIFLKNRLDGLLKPIISEFVPGYMVEKRHELV
jgi:hypothetical protein